MPNFHELANTEHRLAELALELPHRTTWQRTVRNGEYEWHRGRESAFREANSLTPLASELGLAATEGN